jgi:hypothetical protein
VVESVQRVQGWGYVWGSEVVGVVKTGAGLVREWSGLTFLRVVARREDGVDRDISFSF